MTDVDDDPAVGKSNKRKTTLRFVKRRATAALALLKPPPYISLVETGVTSFGLPEFTATGKVIITFYDEKLT